MVRLIGTASSADATTSTASLISVSACPGGASSSSAVMPMPLSTMTAIIQIHTPGLEISLIMVGSVSTFAATRPDEATPQMSGAPGDTPVIISMQCQSIRLAQSNVMVNDLGWSFSPLTPRRRSGKRGAEVLRDDAPSDAHLDRARFR